MGHYLPISQKMRELSRLLLQLRETDASPNSSLSDFINHLDGVFSPQTSLYFPRNFRYRFKKFNFSPHFGLYFPRGLVASPRAMIYLCFVTCLLTLSPTSKSHTIYSMSCNNPHPLPPQDTKLMQSTIRLCDTKLFRFFDV